MMHKPRRRPRKFWALTANSLIFIFCFFTPLEGADIYIKNYVVPVYPGILNRARVQASFLVEYTVKEGRVETIVIISKRVMLPGNRVAGEGAWGDDFVKSINDALTQWTFVQSNAKQTQHFSVSIKFLLSNSNTEGDAARFRFTVQEKLYMPSEITIEMDKIGSDIIVDSWPTNN